MLNILVKIPLFGGLIELAMSNLSYFQNPVYLHRFCVFEIFVRPTKAESVPRPKWLFANRVVSCTMEQSNCIFSVTIAGFSVLNSAIGNGFLMLLWDFVKFYIPHIPKSCMPTCGNGRNNSKTACICSKHKAYDVTHHMLGFGQTVTSLQRSWHGGI